MTKTELLELRKFHNDAIVTSCTCEVTRLHMKYNRNVLFSPNDKAYYAAIYKLERENSELNFIMHHIIGDESDIERWRLKSEELYAQLIILPLSLR